MQSIILNFCWVCGERDGIHDHHVIPQAYGGVNGPQVTVCATHHTMIHTLALRANNEQWQHPLIEHTDSVQKRYKLNTLIGLIHKARMATSNTVKPIQLSQKLDIERSKKLRELKFLLGRSSISATLDACIDSAYSAASGLKN